MLAPFDTGAAQSKTREVFVVELSLVGVAGISGSFYTSKTPSESLEIVP